MCQIIEFYGCIALLQSKLKDTESLSLVDPANGWNEQLGLSKWCVESA